jgi:hypothetical protein
MAIVYTEHIATDKEVTMMKRVWVFSLILMVMASAVWAQGTTQPFNKVGTSAAQFLKFGVGGRAMALGGTQAALSGDVSALYWNPAGIASIQRSSFCASYMDYFVGISHNFIGFVQPINVESSFGVSVIYLDSGDIEITTIEKPEGTGNYYSVTNLAIGLTYAKYVTDRFQGGITLKYIQEGLWREKAQTVAFDLGSILDTGLLGIKLGMSLSNYGGNMRLSGPDLDIDSDPNDENPGNRLVPSYLETEKWSLPLIYRIGIVTDLVGIGGQFAESADSRLSLLFDANDPNDAELRPNMGLEYQWKNILSLRSGGHIRYTDEWDTTENETQWNSHLFLSFGAGLNWEADWGLVQFDFATMDYDLLGWVQHYTISVAF